jgi:hypothetical protein
LQNESGNVALENGEHMTAAVNEADLEVPVLPPTEGERRTAREVRKLWTLYQEKERQLQLTKIELEGLRFMLGEKLWGMKTLLGMCGRGEQWSAFLEKRGIPHQLGHKCVLEQEAAVVALSASAISPFNDEPSEFTKFVQQLMPKLRRLLNNQEDAFKFACALLADLPIMQGEVTRSAVVIYRGDPEKVPAEERTR